MVIIQNRCRSIATELEGYDHTDLMELLAVLVGIEVHALRHSFPKAPFAREHTKKEITNSTHSSHIFLDSAREAPKFSVGVNDKENVLEEVRVHHLIRRNA